MKDALIEQLLKNGFQYRIESGFDYENEERERFLIIGTDVSIEVVNERFLKEYLCKSHSVEGEQEWISSVDECISYIKFSQWVHGDLEEDENVEI